MKYSKTHEWIKLDQDVATVGISDFAQKEVGEIVYIELPAIGHRVIAGDAIVVLESTKAAVDIYTPLSGEIVSINTDLQEHPEKINQFAESEGWLYTIRLSNPKELSGFIDAAAYRAYVTGDQKFTL